MILTKEQTEEFEKVARPLIKFLCEEFHPHVTAIVEGTSAEILESSARVVVADYVKD